MDTPLRILAQANIAWMRFAPDDPRMAEFVEALAPINAEAERHPGFLWRLQGREGNSLDIKAFEDPAILFNLSTWRSLEALYDFTYTSGHRSYLKSRRRWFRAADRPTVVMWWIGAGGRPSAKQAVSRFERLWHQGPTPEAFTFRSPFDPGGSPLTSLYRQRAEPKGGDAVHARGIVVERGSEGVE